MLTTLVFTWLYAAWLTIFIVLLVTRFYYTGLLRVSQTYQLLIAFSITLLLFIFILASLLTLNIITRDIISAIISISITYIIVRRLVPALMLQY